MKSFLNQQHLSTYSNILSSAETWMYRSAIPPEDSYFPSVPFIPAPPHVKAPDIIANFSSPLQTLILAEIDPPFLCYVLTNRNLTRFIENITSTSIPFLKLKFFLKKFLLLFNYSCTPFLPIPPILKTYSPLCKKH